MTPAAGRPPGPGGRPLPHAPADDHGALIVYRLWHPATHTPQPTAMRAWGPLYRFDRHTPPADHPREDPNGRSVWYGGEALETAVREVFDRGPRQADVCAGYRMAAVRLAQPCPLLDLTLHAVTIGAPDDLGDRVAGVDYDITRSWARAIHDDHAPPGLRYHSARHRAATERVGVKVVLWGTGLIDEVVSDVSVTHPGAWRRLVTILDRAGVAVRRLAHCHRCTQ